MELSVEGIRKSYGAYEALKGVSFSLEKGDILGIIGENGAGKSTLLSTIATILKPSAGTVCFQGKDIFKNKKRFLSRLGYVPQEIALFEELTGKENLLFFGRNYGLKKKDILEKIQTVCEMTDFPEEWLNKPVSKYSGGMKRKINIGAALLHQPEILLLDEPVANLDFETEDQVIATLQSLAAGGTTILYVGHQMEQMERLCNKLCLLKDGEVFVFGETRKLLEENGQEKSLKQLWKELLRNPEKE